MSGKTELIEVPAVAGAGAATILEVISRASADPATDVDKLERLLTMYERITARESAQAFSTAMNLAQEEMGQVSRDASNPQTRSKYASFEALDRAMRPIYTKHGFSVSYDTGDAPHELMVRVIAKITHKDGHMEVRQLDMPADGKGAKGNDVMTKTHATMSAVSYGRRGLLKMIFNIAEGDDDGNAAGGNTISADQVDDLRKLIELSKSDEADVTKYLKVDNLESLHIRDYGKADNALRMKIQKNEMEAAK